MQSLPLENNPAEQGLDIEHLFGDRHYVKVAHLKAGQEIGKHRHPTAHVSVLLKGEVILRTVGYERRIQGPYAVNVPAGDAHSIITLTPCEWLCIHEIEHGQRELPIMEHLD